MSHHPFALQGLFQHGQPMEGRWQWPGEQAKAHFEDIVRACLAEGAAPMPHLDACVVQGHPPHAPVRWSLCSHTAELALSLNGQAVPLGVECDLHDGDTIEIGLYSLRVHQPEAQTTAHERAMLAFELSDLDTAPHQQAPGGFSDLIAAEPSSAAPDVPAPRPADTPPQPEDVLDVLDVLHAQYLRKLRDPSYAGDGAHWHTMLQPSEAGAVSDPLDDLVETARRDGKGHSVGDLLGQTQSIHDVLARLDTSATGDVLALDGFDSVIHLFAPADTPTNAAPGIAGPDASAPPVLRGPLPALTLREHHSLSLDSAMPFLLTPDTPAPPTSPLPGPTP
ncbi:MAG: TagK domain-containing protein [Rhodoferax sp.]|nr:TagK domain-containing protein [Rhodoferax sp.]